MTRALPSAHEIRRVKDIDELAQKAAQEFVDLSISVTSTSKTFDVALSGGNTPKALFAELVKIHEADKNKIPWGNIRLFWGDERWVPMDDAQSNYRMTKEFLLSKVPIPDSNIFPIPTEEANANITADAYEQVLRESFGVKRGAIPSFDVVYLGMGPDGHCASLFPQSKVVEAYARHEADKSQLVMANWVAQFNMFRITLTPPLINAGKQVIFLVSGPEKKDALKEVLEGEYDPEIYPSQLIHPTSGHLYFYVDDAAAS